VNRRGLLGLSAALLAAGCGRTSARWVSHEPSPEASQVLAPGSPAASGSPAPSPSPTKDSGLTRVLRRYLSPTPENPGKPMFAGAVAIAMVNGAVVDQAAVGDALRYGAGPVELAAPQRVPMRMDSVFDLASITKVYTAILVLQQVDQGRLALDAPVAGYLSEFDGPGRGGITVAQLLTHTSALPVGAKVTGLSTMEARWSAVLTTPLVAGVQPGREFRYSSVGLMIAGRLVERVTGRSLDQALRTGLLQPLGLKETGFLPKTWMSDSDRAARMVATDARSSRGLLRGVVHDDVCHVLGGVAGHAGVFSTAADLAAIGQLLLGDGVYKGKRVLSEAGVRAMVANYNQGLPAVDPERPGRPSDHGLGVTINQPWLMGRLASTQAYGHTGFTGTSLVVCRRRKLVLVLLTNRAHPNWSWANPDPVRVATANLFAG
jgi:CubicO group peptidase (beta-lactamase class C family)